MITCDEIIRLHPELAVCLDRVATSEEVIVVAYLAGRLDAQKEEIERLDKKIIEEEEEEG